ncbi:unnamed protein product [Bursaphelenchus okinawaensis]|uniref:Uncharacterized protein n=1 Tax=Bursaphelenchus okinawaensis TaxID=465554 RepID=A0A811LKM7_9BILA|nr:unnamed protein product [Bursaphelenchus okinawaensis]CAG9124008.1 unnamed protein product [Bursaphelenchus okinawaensis]
MSSSGWKHNSVTVNYEIYNGMSGRSVMLCEDGETIESTINKLLKGTGIKEPKYIVDMLVIKQGEFVTYSGKMSAYDVSRTCVIDGYTYDLKISLVIQVKVTVKTSHHTTDWMSNPTFYTVTISNKATVNDLFQKAVKEEAMRKFGYLAFRVKHNVELGHSEFSSVTPDDPIDPSYNYGYMIRSLQDMVFEHKQLEFSKRYESVCFPKRRSKSPVKVKKMQLKRPKKVKCNYTALQNQMNEAFARIRELEKQSKKIAELQGRVSHSLDDLETKSLAQQLAKVNIQKGDEVKMGNLNIEKEIEAEMDKLSIHKTEEPETANVKIEKKEEPQPTRYRFKKREPRAISDDYVFVDPNLHFSLC